MIQRGIFEKGERITPIWSQPPRLGAPLHAGQISPSRTTLFTVTRSTGGQTCVASAVDAATGRLHWQQQLGLVCQGEPLVLKNEVLVLDRGGGLFRFQPGKSQPEILARPPEQPLLTSPQLLAGRDGQTAYEVLCVGDASGPRTQPRLVIRRYRVGEGLTEYRVPQALLATPGGPAALGEDCLIVPLSNGVLLRQPLSGDLRPEPGPDWRDRTADPSAPWYIVHVGGDDFVMTDYPVPDPQDPVLIRRGLLRFTWPKGPNYKRVKWSTPLTARIVSPPVVLQPDNDTSPPRICFADSEGVLWLVDADSLDLNKARRWALVGDAPGQIRRGKITAGPFLRGGRIGCIVDGRHLFWIDPANAKPVWDRPYTAPEAIIGQPQLVGGVLLVADLSRRLVGLDPATGRPHGKGYEIQAKVAPTAAPVEFGSNQVFVPLSDGTVLLPELAEFQKR